MKLDKNEVLKLFPSSEFRKYQKETVEKIVDGFNTGVRCILIDAPTGSGKSVINTTFCRALQPAFYATPQLNLIDQIQQDKNIGTYFTNIKGRQNYFCAHDPYATVDVGLCRRIKEYSCQKVEVCPYWRQKMKALRSSVALMSFAYFILEGHTETDYSFGRRNLLILDESHNIDSHVINYISLTVSPWSLPFKVYEKVRNAIGGVQSLIDAIALVGAAKDVAVMEKGSVVQTTLLGGELTISQASGVRRLEDFINNADNFLNSVERTEWVWHTEWTSYKGKNYQKLVVQPLYARSFMDDMVWSRANYYIVSSATFLNANDFVKETGLDKSLKLDEVLRVVVPSTFPVENRPIIDTTNGKLTYKYKEQNFVPAVRLLEKVLDQEANVNVAVHCHSYEISIGIQNLIADKYKLRLVTHTPETRADALKTWVNSKGKVFLSVSFEEGYDWVGEICEAQVLFKVPYKHIQDRRVARRLEKRDWKWYRNEALKTVVQAYGRAVRSPEDRARFYVIDLSFVDLIKRCKGDIPRWFRDALPEHWRVLLD